MLRLQKLSSKKSDELRDTHISIVTHEMRTPLLSAIFFLKQLIQLLTCMQFEADLAIPRAQKYCNLMMSQLVFVSSFADDLLDIK